MESSAGYHAFAARAIQGCESVAPEPFHHIPQLLFSSVQGASASDGPCSPSAAGFIDHLLSTGFPLTLLGVERMARILQAGLDAPHLAHGLQQYAQQTRNELHATAQPHRSPLREHEQLRPISLDLHVLLLAAASFSETVRRLGKPAPGDFNRYCCMIMRPSDRDMKKLSRTGPPEALSAGRRSAARLHRRYTWSNRIDRCSGP